MKNIYFSCIALLCTTYTFGQGCSDAGFCSLGVLKNNVADSARHTLSFGLNYGVGYEQTNITNAYIEYGSKLSERLSFRTKLTANYATGFLGSAFDIGDIYGTLNYALRTKSASTINIIGGVKVPLTAGNHKNKDGKPLPLDYQASIGTYDAIGGINYIVNQSWEFDAGIQVPVIQVNKNTFFPDEHNDFRANEFAPTNNFKRKSDVLGRIGYYIQLPASAIVLKPSLLGIYHLGRDTYEDRFGQRNIIEGSDGFTLNGSIVGTKRFKNGNSLELLFATPFIVRKVRPDGLTRKGVINVQYTISL
ncbi:hypothetical protein [Pedobacter kyonggii]|uniref:Uncharacterized protein n=1 Tax=Pedobacter kyonggii TaxID=1926871 RepID=A0A4Q9HFC9_9SPHI|nr:hypothetical protein [Pedobacter kyonggii]TBO43595.1 hypothetical protein EYS08_06485 [Pedobacter kyonggii]